MDWELSKENVQPLRSGRDVKLLNAALKTKIEAEASAKIKVEKLESERRSFERDIQFYDGDDPLAPWLRYIRWIKDSYPSGGIESESLPVLEKCTRTFQRVARYRTDVRYLRVWIQYADACVDAKDIFTFLEKNEIGQDHALFYEAYATNLELRRNYAKASEVYNWGIARRAEPTERLVNMYKAFEDRMQKRLERKKQEAAEGLSSAPATDENAGRRTLAPLRSSNPSVRPPQPMQNQQRPKRKAAPTPPKSKLDIFVDEAFGGPSAGPSIAASGRSEALGPAPLWEKLPTQAEGSKENWQKASQWSGMRLPQKKTKSANAGSGLEVFVDEEFAHSDSHGSGKSDNEASIRQKLEGKILAHKKRTESESLKEDPLRHFTKVQPAPPGHTGPVPSLVAVTNASPKFSKGAALATFAYDTEAIKGPHGQELSFEELHARDWEQTHSLEDEPVPQPPPSTAEPVPERPRSLLSLFADVAGPAEISSTETQGATDSEGLAAEYQRLNIGGSELGGQATRAHSGPGSEKAVADDGFLGGLNAPTESPVSRHGGLVDPTINTQEAMAEIMSMFNRPLPVETGRKNLKSSVSKERREARGAFSQPAFDSPPAHDPTLQIFADDFVPRAAKPPTGKEKTSRGFGPVAGPENKNKASENGAGFESDAENRPPPTAQAPRAFPARDIQSPTAQESALRPLSVDRIQQLNVQFSAGQLASDYPESEQTEPLFEETEPLPNPFESGGNPAEAALRVAGQGELEGDDFQVWSDDPTERASNSNAPQPVSFLSKPKLPRDDPSAERSRPAEHPASLETPVAGFSGRLEGRGLGSTRGSQAEPDDRAGREAGAWSDVFIPVKSLARSPGSVQRPLQSRDASIRPSDSAPQPAALQPQPPAPKLNLTPGVPLDPWDPALIASLLNTLNPPLTSYEGFVNLGGESFEGASALRLVKRSAKSGGAMLQLGRETYEVKQCVGSGAFATVYLAYRMDAGYTTDLMDESEDDGMLALKVQRPACPWEFYIYRQLDVRIPAAERRSFGSAKRLFCYAGTSVLVAPYGEHGTLQDLVNAYLAAGQKGMDSTTEAVAVFYTIELLRMLEVLHEAGIIHGDFKPDNLLIRNDCERWEDWAPGRPGSWRDKGLTLVDWGRSIDLASFTPGQTFSGDCMTEAFRCIEMVEKRPWSFQVDTYGLCTVVHCLLFGSYMEVEKITPAEGEAPLYRQRAPLKRYWNVPLWQRLFDTLLNVPSCDKQPQLAPLREAFEEYLNTKSKSVKPLLIKQNIMMFDRKSDA
ncbi:putative Protein kinase [Klebsormidium nitens]|uniref:Uncharacterized protein n=1 Tax=Klebsormidium nitens TaxID=105231 RepID=A0A1Y1HKE3_KLENI|nr:putative Protein kinase [Klebsormidium nitens]|eukprot:GAQ79054.1 putative Protein kinase [Klebsormidium nitens]